MQMQFTTSRTWTVTLSCLQHVYSRPFLAGDSDL